MGQVQIRRSAILQPQGRGMEFPRQRHAEIYRPKVQDGVYAKSVGMVGGVGGRGGRDGDVYEGVLS